MQHTVPKKRAVPAHVQVIDTAEMVLGWFDRYLRLDDPKPSIEACGKLARDFQVAANRHRNAEIERDGPVPLESLKDVSPAAVLGEKAARFRDAALIEGRALED